MSLELIKRRLGIVGELVSFAKRRKMWWMLPLFAIILALGLVIFLAAQSPVSPFVYVLF